MVYLRRGDTVIIHGLLKKAQFNGLIGEILTVDEEKRCAHILISRCGRTSDIAVSIRNLKMVEERPPPSFASNGIVYDSIYDGCRVRIYGLSARGHFNGMEGIAHDYYDHKWKIKLRSSDKWLVVSEKHLEVLDISDENGRRRREWRHPSQNREDPRWLIGKMVVKQLESSRIIGKVMKWHDYHIGASVRYEDGDFEFLPVDKAESMVVGDSCPEELEAARRRIDAYDDVPIRYSPPASSPGETALPTRKRRRVALPTEDDSSSPSLDLSGETPLDSSSASPLSRDHTSESTPSDLSASSKDRRRPVIFFNSIFVDHEGGGQDKGGKWLEEIVKKLRHQRVSRKAHRTLSNACQWVSEASQAVTLEEVAATGVHSEDYLQDLRAVDRYINTATGFKQRAVDLASKRCYSIIGRRRAEVPGECIMDKHTLSATLLRCGLTRDALQMVLSGETPVALVLARPACHHVPFRLGLEEGRSQESLSTSFDSTESIKCCRCERGDDEPCLLVCDNPDCGQGWHSFCLPYSLGRDVLFMKDFRTGRWFCPQCLSTEDRISPAEAEACRLLISVCQSRAKEPPFSSRSIDSPEEEALRKLPIGNEISLGFCFINAVAFAVKQLLNSISEERRIMILDVDVHHGNGNETAFYDDPRVLTFSIHRYGPDSTGEYVMPGTGWHEDLGDEAVPKSIGMNLNFEMSEGEGDREYVDVVTRIVRPVIEQWRPDVVVLLCGFDAIDHSSAAVTFTGPGMDCKLSPEWFAWLYPYLASIVPSGRMVCCTEGGYNPESSGRAGWLLVGSMVEHLTAVEKDRPKAISAAIERRPDVLPISDFARQRSWESRLNEHINKFRSAGWNIPAA
ncbi:histone deacetylase, putative [Perkinsus marinus ATCC 50983]|uniref:Histone deacetylase, putative n=1 Tax=Perkinsus marinus (strain ATCC 50983 / TXsc) TaxID=423536 RepID=C5LNN0_PERM5|nr:histone deacetylase, putative [Perkinsus marinus ATCC 50983]EER01651.1 histone deacetylase, putative [Perkinsus marinus ATCC 50983]|eukprot:XP_002768933.1 histone deacetylase, putative [Perkinsus marinus ATCC 50983]